jgi:hypothetical protein
MLVTCKTRGQPMPGPMSVIRTPELVERAWRLPVATTFNRQLTWQSNGSRCGPAVVANAYRSLGEAAITEGKVLAGTGRCWTGVCIVGLTLDELADGARAGDKTRIGREAAEKSDHWHWRLRALVLAMRAPPPCCRERDEFAPLHEPSQGLRLV